MGSRFGADFREGKGGGGPSAAKASRTPGDGFPHRWVPGSAAHALCAESAALLHGPAGGASMNRVDVGERGYLFSSLHDPVKMGP